MINLTITGEDTSDRTIVSSGFDLDKVDVANGHELTVESGVHVEVDSTATVEGTLEVRGTLVIEG